MSYIRSLSNSISKTFTKSTDFFTISSRGHFNTITSEDKGKMSKPKHVSFKDVQIISVESYKEYNKLDEVTLEDNEINCMKRCNIYCNCRNY